MDDRRRPNSYTVRQMTVKQIYREINEKAEARCQGAEKRAVRRVRRRDMRERKKGRKGPSCEKKVIQGEK